MRSVNLSSSARKLRDAAETLSVRWQETKDAWRDANARNIEENSLEPLGLEVNNSLQAIRHIGEVLSRALRECAEE